MSESIKEEWRVIPGYPRYRVSNLGNIRKISNGRPIKGVFPQGYHRVTIADANGKYRGVPAHRLVLWAFVGPAPEGTECGHRNGIRSDNRLCNLAWITKKENAADRKLHGTDPVGERNGFAKLSEQSVEAIRELYAQGVTAPSLAKAFRVHRSLIWLVVSKKQWPHVA